jgi:hypothetical protein
MTTPPAGFVPNLFKRKKADIKTMEYEVSFAGVLEELLRTIPLKVLPKKNRYAIFVPSLEGRKARILLSQGSYWDYVPEGYRTLQDHFWIFPISLLRYRKLQPSMFTNNQFLINHRYNLRWDNLYASTTV